MNGTLSLEAVSLQELVSQAELLTRVDRKYLLNLDQLRCLVVRLQDELDVLEIDGKRVFGYASTYQDTPDLSTFRAHVQGRRRRYKIRVREYLDTGGKFVEIKYKRSGQLTAKARAPHAEADVGALGTADRAFAASVIGRVYDLELPHHLQPVLRTSNHRATFVSRQENARMTVDARVIFDDDLRTASLRDEYVLLETKSTGSATEADRVLRSMNVRPTSVSKYCVGVALLRDDVTANPWHRLVRTYFEHVPERVVTTAPLALAG